MCACASVEYVLKIRNVFLTKLAAGHICVGGRSKSWQVKLKCGVGVLPEGREQNFETIVRRVYRTTAQNTVQFPFSKGTVDN